MQVLIKKWGNSASVRLPAAIMEAAKLSLDQPVDVREDAGRVIIEPVRTPISTSMRCLPVSPMRTSMRKSRQVGLSGRRDFEWAGALCS